MTFDKHVSGGLKCFDRFMFRRQSMAKRSTPAVKHAEEDSEGEPANAAF